MLSKWKCGDSIRISLRRGGVEVGITYLVYLVEFIGVPHSCGGPPLLPSRRSWCLSLNWSGTEFEAALQFAV